MSLLFKLILFSLLNKTIELNERRIWNPKITKTVAITGEGINELYSCIKDHKNFLDNNMIIKQKLDERYIKTVKSFISNQLIEKFWSDEIDESLGKEHPEWPEGYTYLDKFLDEMKKQNNGEAVFVAMSISDYELMSFNMQE